MREETIQYLPLDKIDCERQVRDKVPDESLIGLARSLQEVGVQQPLRCRRNGERFLVVDGERRLRAARLAKFFSIAVIIEEKELGEGELIQRQLIANIQRLDLAPLETARAITKLMGATGWNAAETAGHIGKSASTVAKLTALLSLPAEILAEVEVGRLPASTAYEIGKIGDPENQAKLAAEASSGQLTRDAVSGHAKRARNGAANAEQVPSRFVAKLSGDRSVTVCGAGLSLDAVIAWLEELLGKARRARTRGIELKAFVKSLRDQAKAT